MKGSQDNRPSQDTRDTPKSWKDLKMGLFQDTQGTSNHEME